MEGAAFVCAVMSAMQNTSLDMLMYYFIQPGAWNGVFDYYTLDRLKTYYSFLLFSKIYKLCNQVEAKCDDSDIYVVSAKNDEKLATMITYYSYDSDACEKTVKINIDSDNAEFYAYMLNEDKDAECIGTVGSECEFILKPNSVIYLESK